jgi:hypothetical protein
MAERHDTLEITNACRRRRIDRTESPERFADDRELPLDGGPQQLVGGVIREGPPLDEATNAGQRLANVMQQDARITLQTTSPPRLRFVAADTDW